MRHQPRPHPRHRMRAPRLDDVPGPEYTSLMSKHVHTPAQFREEALSSSKLWDREFLEIQSIPSSTRLTASQGIIAYYGLLNFQRARRVLDVGCGNGRNAVYFARLGAEVLAIDSSPVAISMTRSFVQRAKVADKVSIRQAPLEDAIAEMSDSFDLVLDSYVSCHIHEPESLQSYLSELLSLTAASGHLLSLQFGSDDEFYASHIVRRRPLLGHDPFNGVVKRLYGANELRDILTGVGRVEYGMNLQFADKVRGVSYLRSIFSMALSPVRSRAK
jgi:SAM-dependent methyltransferase